MEKRQHENLINEKGLIFTVELNLILMFLSVYLDKRGCFEILQECILVANE